MTPTLPRRSFLGWTAAIAGCALLTRPALAVPESEPVIISFAPELKLQPMFYSMWLPDRVTGQRRLVSSWAPSGEQVAF